MNWSTVRDDAPPLCFEIGSLYGRWISYSAVLLFLFDQLRADAMVEFAAIDGFAFVHPRCVLQEEFAREAVFLHSCTAIDGGVEYQHNIVRILVGVTLAPAELTVLRADGALHIVGAMVPVVVGSFTPAPFPTECTHDVFA